MPPDSIRLRHATHRPPERYGTRRALAVRWQQPLHPYLQEALRQHTHGVRLVDDRPQLTTSAGMEPNHRPPSSSSRTVAAMRVSAAPSWRRWVALSGSNTSRLTCATCSGALSATFCRPASVRVASVQRPLVGSSRRTTGRGPRSGPSPLRAGPGCCRSRGPDRSAALWPRRSSTAGPERRTRSWRSRRLVAAGGRGRPEVRSPDRPGRGRRHLRPSRRRRLAARMADQGSPAPRATRPMDA